MPNPPMPTVQPTPHIYVSAGIIWQNNHFLAACRPAGKTKAGYWEFPGGKLEAGETPVQALSRELYEELGILLSKSQLWREVQHQYEDVTVTLYFIHVTKFEGSPQSKEGQELRWVSVNEAQQLPFLPADIALLQELCPPHEVVHNE